MDEQHSAQELPYTNRELREKWHDLANSLQRIELQTTTTNGRVDSLENWKYMVLGAMGVLSMVVIPILAWAIGTLVSIDSRIQTAIDKSLSAYDISK